MGDVIDIRTHPKAVNIISDGAILKGVVTTVYTSFFRMRTADLVTWSIAYGKEVPELECGDCIVCEAKRRSPGSHMLQLTKMTTIKRRGRDD
jgi:hypothetical protein